MDIQEDKVMAGVERLESALAKVDQWHEGGGG
jgi:hypothetical protein